MKIPSAYVVNATGHPLLWFRTANAAEQGEMRLSASDICTANIAEVADGEWALISRYGDHPSPDGKYTQRFDRAQAEKLVSTTNSLSGLAVRIFKNLRHGLGWKKTIPVWEGHPDDNPERWPKAKLLAELEDLRTGNAGLEGKVRWNPKGLATRTRGPLHPSPMFLHWPPAGDPLAVFPELLESVGLWPSVNIPGMPAWTSNANPFADTPAEPENTMTPQQLAALAKALNQPESTDPAKLIELAGSAFQLSTANAAKAKEQADALTTANAAKADIESQLTTANSQVAILKDDAEKMKTANAALASANNVLVIGALNFAEKRGAITPAERETFKGRLTTANTAEAAFTELMTRKAMNVDKVEIEVNGTRRDLSTANARAAVYDEQIAKRMKENGNNYDAAVASLRNDPTFAPLFGAMQDPTKQTAA